MATIELADPNVKKVWTAKRYDEYIRASGFKTFMARSDTSVIHVRGDLSKNRGDTLNIPLFAKLQGEPKRGAQPIEGNEKGLANYNFPVVIDWVGDGVAVSNADTFKTEIDLLDAGRSGLTNFMAEVTRNEIIDALNSKNGVNFKDASDLQLNAWVTLNQYRTLFGSATSNYSNVFAAALGNVAGTDKLNKKIIEIVRKNARAAYPNTPLMRPSTVKEVTGMSGKAGAIVESYICFVGSRSFYHLKQDAELKEDLRYAMERGRNNPLFQPDDLMIDNVVIREIPELTDRCLIEGAGASGVDVEPYFFCGAQAIGYAIGQEPKFTTDDRDYGFIKGVAVRELRGIKKIVYNNLDHGMITGYVAAPAE